MPDAQSVQEQQTTPGAIVAEKRRKNTASQHRAAPAPAWRTRLLTHGTVGLGGLLGANARYAIGIWSVGKWDGNFPWGTLIVNVMGSFLLGFFLALVTERFSGRDTTRMLVATGFLGAFTTFSTFGYETTTFMRDGAISLAFAYTATTLILGIVAIVVGVLAARGL